ncbi:MAG: VCBS repeat-containing protein, partial [Bacteroidota bacterium]
DFDKDGDLDLYVVSGGNDEKELNKDLEDRLYLNDGKGNLKRLPISLPHTNGGTIAVGDFDNDGFDDLFVGARSVPAYYGLSPYSFILRNKEGFGLELVDKQRFGMITHSQWADIDNDSDLDLVFCGDWLNMSVLENQGDNKFVYQAQEIGLGNTAGLWNTFVLKDLNNDGQLDIIGGNAGSNFKWKASVEQPVKMHLVDMDNNGKPEPLIFHHYFSQYKPFASLDQLAAQAPVVRKQFVNYNLFSSAQSVDDFSQVKSEAIIETKVLQELRSMVYLSENGKYKGIPLPQVAQMSTIQGLTFHNAELIFVGNHQDYLTELGESSSNSGGLLSNFDATTGQFKVQRSLPLPANLNPRSIIPLEKNQYLIACNNGVQYLLDRQINN